MSGQGSDWANPGPAGLVALAIACFLFYAILGGHVEHTCIPLIGCWLIGGALVQFTVALIELKEGNILGGNVFLVFSAFFMLVGGLEMIFKYLAVANGWPAIDARIDGYGWMALWLALWVLTPAYCKSPLVLTLAILALDVAVPIVCLHDLGILGAQYAPVAGNFLGLAGIFGLYVAGAIVLNTEFGKTILPVGGPIIKTKSLGA